jgi:hypothetical protein
MNKAFMMLAGLAFVVGPAWAQNTYTVEYTTATVILDGETTESAWAAANNGGGNFVGHDTGVPGTASTQQTSFKALWDDNNLYIAFTTQDTSPVFDSSLTTNNATLTFSKDDFEFFLDPISSRNSEANPNHKYQMVFYPETDAVGVPVNSPNAFKWVAAGATDFPFPPTTWPSGLNMQVKMTRTGSFISPTGYTVEASIPWSAFDVALVNTEFFNLPPANSDVWSAQICRVHDLANNSAATKWNPTALAGFRTKPWGLWTFSGRTGSSAASDWQLLQ